MAVDQRTTNFSWPKPHPSNRLDEDVVRLRESLDAIDGLLFWAAQRIDSPDPLGTIPALVVALKATQANLLQTLPADSAVYTYDGFGRVTTASETLPGGATRVTDYVYSGDVLAHETTTLGGVSQRTTYTYSGGRVVSSARTIL